MMIVVDIVGGQCNWSTVRRITWSLFKLSIAMSEQDHDFVATGACQGDVDMAVLIEVADHQGTRFLTDM
jgi:hypothetical protein